MKKFYFLPTIVLIVLLLSNFQLKAQCTFSISANSSTNKSCKTALEDVVWLDANNVSVTNNDVIKNIPSGSWNADGVSKNFVNNNEFVQTVVAETNTSRMIGLNTSNDNSSYTDLEYAIYLISNGNLYIYENGAYRGNWGSYESGDTLRISVQNNEVYYIKNSYIFYKSTVAPSFPMFVDFSIASPNGTLQKVVVGKNANTIYTANAYNPGASPTYQWKLNGVNVGTNSINYSNNLADGDVLQCVLTPGAGGCAVGNVNSNFIRIKSAAVNRDVIAGIRNDSIQANSCFYSTEDVSWKTIVGLRTNGKNNLIKTNNASGWDGVAFSYNKIEKGGYMQTIVNETTTARMIGLNQSYEGVSYGFIDYAFYLTNSGYIYIYENGSNKGLWGSYVSGDTLRIAVVGNKVRYLQNGNIIYSSLNTPTLPLFVNISMLTNGSTAEGITVSNPTYGRFKAKVEGLANVRYQWKLNGVNVGTNNPIYTNTSLTTNDSLYCLFIVNSTVNCGIKNQFRSNTIVVKDQNPKNNLVFAIRSDSTSDYSCNFAFEKVGWTTLNGLVSTGSNNLTKVSGINSWNAAGFSYNKVEQEGFMQTIVAESNTNRMIGLNAFNSNVSYTDIDYAFYLTASGGLNIYENGSSRGNWGSYASGDTLRIAVVGNKVRYIKNGNTVYTSNIAPTLPLYVDLCINTVGGTLQDITVNNTTYGKYTALVEGVANYKFQWKLNGANVGTNSNVYINNSTSEGDTISCELTLTKTLGCSSDTIEQSNEIIINKQSFADKVVFAIRSDSSAAYSCKFAFEEVGWQSLSGLKLRGSNNLTKVDNSTSWDAGAFSYNKVEDGGFMQTIVDETNTFRMIGLNNSNTSVSYTDIDYAFYLTAGGSILIYENGSYKGNWGAYSTGDTMRVSVIGNTVRYLQNGNIIYTSLTAPNLPLYVDLSIRDVGGTLKDITVNNTTYGVYSAFVDGVDSVSYQWKLNGVNVGSDTSVYTNTSTLAGDTISCDVLLINTIGCAPDTIKSSNRIVINSQSLIDNTIFSIRSDSSTKYSCNYAFEEVGWQSISSVALSGSNNITKVGSSSGWDAGGFSYNKVEEGGFMQTIVDETNTSRMIGLNSVNTNVSYTDIDYAIYLTSGGSLYIYENGSSKGNWGAYSSGDTLRISVIGNSVRYIQNGNIFYTSTITPTLPLYVDMSLRDVGGTLKNIFVNNTTYGKYSAFVDGAAETVSYQWKLNGVNVGTDTNIYINTSTVNGDTISCDLSLINSNGCAPDTITSSNRIIINSQSLIDNTIFAVRNDSVSYPSCKYAYEEVGWQSLTAVELNGSNNVTKVGNSTGWDAGGFSYNKVESGGFMQTVVAETNTARMIGLNAVNTNVSYSDIDFAFYLTSGGSIFIYENGTNQGNWGAYTTGDTMQIAVVGSTVRYMQNGNIIYSSINVPNLPLYVDYSIATIGGTLKDIVVNNATSGYYSAFVDGADSVSYQWKLNGVHVGTDDPNYLNTTTVAGDTISCDVILTNTIGCAPDTIKGSNRIIINEQSIIDDVLYSIRNDSITRFSCLFATEEVAWQTISSLETSGSNNVKKVGSNNGWDAGAFSFNKVENGGFMQTIVKENNTSRMIGLNATNVNVSYTDIDYAFYLISNGSMNIYENGTYKASIGSYKTGDTLRIAVLNNEVKYYKNSKLLYTSTVAPTLPLFVDLSILTIGATLEKITVYNGLYGNFTAFIDGATNVSYTWKLNGTIVGTDSAAYSNLALSDGDRISSELAIVGATGCGLDTLVVSNNIDITEVPFGDFVRLQINNEGAVTNSCQYALVDALWQLDDNVLINGNSVSKPSGSINWDGMAFSANDVNNNDFMQFVIPSNSTNLMVGLNNLNTSSSYGDIDYAFYLNRGTLRIYENGSIKGSFGTYNSNDIFRIDVINNVVYYKRNGILVYTSTIAPTLPLYIDMSLYDVGTVVNDFVIGTAANGKFRAITENAGVNPSYQWKLNGVDVGTDSNIYENYNLKQNDVISCVLTPDYGKCSISTLASNSIEISDNPPLDFEPVFTPTTTNWLGNNTDWEDASNWSNGIPHGGSIAVITGGGSNPLMDNFKRIYGLEVGAGANLNMTASTKLKIYGTVVNNGGLFPNGARVEMSRCKDSSKWNSTSQVTIQDLIMNNPKGLNVINGKIRITDSLIFEQGRIYNGSNQIVFRENSKWAFASDSMYIAGAAEKFGNTAFTFPIGDSNQLRPISISAPSAIGHAFLARYYKLNPDSVKPSNYDRSMLGAGLDHVSGCEYWILNRTAGNSAVNVTLGWNDRSCGVTNLSDLRVARWNGAQWQDHGNGGTSGSNSAGTVITQSAVNSFSPFTLASSTAANPLPITLIDFNARLHNKIVYLEWETSSEINNDYFTLEKSVDGLNWTEFASIKGAGNSTSFKKYESKDYHPYTGVSYYRLKQTDFNGEFDYSKIVSIRNIDHQISIYPNPIKDWIYIENLNFEAEIKVYDINGKLIYTGNTAKIDVSEWARGVYQLKLLNTSSKEMKMYKLVK